MPRYVSRPRAFFVEDEVDEPKGSRESIDVYETAATDTGLLDAHGNPILRLKDKIGF